MPSIFHSGLFAEQVAYITGGGSGIGLCVAQTLGQLGAKVAICGRSKDRLDTAARALERKGVTVAADVCDIRDPEAIERFVTFAQSRVGPATILINNAGGQFPTLAESLSSRGWEAVIRNNLNGTFFFTQAVAKRHMIPNRCGRIVDILANIARGFPGMIHTGAARAGVENMIKTLAIEWAEYNIQINGVAPGIIQTGGLDQYPPEFVDACRKRTPMKRLGTPEEVAQLVAYLACEAASFVNGVTWYIDGGAHLWGDTWTLAHEPTDLPRGVRELADPDG